VDDPGQGVYEQNGTTRPQPAFRPNISKSSYGVLTQGAFFLFSQDMVGPRARRCLCAVAYRRDNFFLASEILLASIA